MTNNIPSPRNSYVEKNLDIMKPTYRKHIWSVPWPFIILRFRCVYIISSVVELLNYDKIKPPWLNFFISYYYSFLRILQKKIRIRYWIYLWPLLGLKGLCTGIPPTLIPKKKRKSWEWGWYFTFLDFSLCIVTILACVASVSVRVRSVIKVLLFSMFCWKNLCRNACCSKILLLLSLLLQVPICSRINSWFRV